MKRVTQYLTVVSDNDISTATNVSDKAPEIQQKPTIANDQWEARLSAYEDKGLAKRTKIVCQTLVIWLSSKNFFRLAMSQNIAHVENSSYTSTKIVFELITKTSRNNFCLFVLVQRCFPTWRNVLTLLKQISNVWQAMFDCLSRALTQALILKCNNF